MLQAAGLIAGLVAFYMILGRLGTVAVAAGNIVMRIASLSIMPAIGIGVAVQTRGRPEPRRRRPRRRARRAGAASSSLPRSWPLLGAILLTWPEPARRFRERSGS